MLAGFCLAGGTGIYHSFIFFFSFNILFLFSMTPAVFITWNS